ncbi:MAG: glutathione S-transferase [Betaproteobacteria bacterium]|nr:glutathione S-transferase [Betaproteobacteria bacterium]
MLQLCGFAASNYYNKVKIALIEKGIPFEEVCVFPSGDEALLAESPMGKVPYLRTRTGAIAESQVILEYLEDVHPEPRLFPRDPLARARVREIIAMLELNLELVVRRIYPEAFFGGVVPEQVKVEVQREVRRGLAALGRCASFSRYVAGPEFTAADCAAVVHLPVLRAAMQAVYGTDPLHDALPQVRSYLDHVSARPSVRRVESDRRLGLEAFRAFRRTRVS